MFVSVICAYGLCIATPRRGYHCNDAQYFINRARSAGIITEHASQRHRCQYSSPSTRQRCRDHHRARQPTAQVPMASAYPVTISSAFQAP